jgi:hypothetical protein
VLPNPQNQAAVNDRGLGFLFPYISILYGSGARVSGAGVPCGSQGEHGGQCYEVASATGAEPYRKLM